MTGIAPAPARPAERPSVPPSPQLWQIRDMIYHSAGIFQADDKLRFLGELCIRRMQVLGVGSLEDYLECLTSKPTHQSELVSLLNELTIGETCFFRDQPQLEALRSIVLTRILEARSPASPRHLRIWSAGCSTGEEPYTLCMMLLEEATQRLQGWSFEILATDLNEYSIAHAKKGVYGAYSTRNLPALYKNKYFVANGDELQVTPEIQAQITFSRANLAQEDAHGLFGNMDLVICCNVLIYFDMTAKRRVVRQFSDDLLPHGYLFLGPAESLYGVSDDFRLVHLPLTTAYVKSEKRPITKAGRV